MTKYFAKESYSFESYDQKYKSGDIVELSDDQAAVFNGIVPGMFEAYDPAIHTPAPVVEVPAAEEPAAETPAEAEAPAFVQSEVGGTAPEGMTTENTPAADAQ
jgi:hypothetical protein